MGRLCALSLNRAGHNIQLFDKDSKTGTQSAAYAAAGLLTPLGESLHAERNIVELGFASMKLWPKLLSTLEQYHFFQQQGSIVLSHEQDKGDYLRLWRHLQHAYPEHEVTSLNRQQLNELEPELSHRFNQGLYLPQEGQIGNRKLLSALAWQLEHEAVVWHEHSNVTGIHIGKEGGRLEVNDRQMEFDLILDCRGMGARAPDAKPKAAPLARLRGVRGELFQLFAPEVNISRPVRLMHPRYQLYIAPKPKGFYVVGATEIESDDQSPMTVRSAMELLSAAYSVHSGFAEANIRQHVSQLRPAFDDNQPQIRVDKRLIQINGLYRHGFLIAPAVLKQVEQAVNRQLSQPSSDIHKFNSLLPIHNMETESHL